MKKHLLASTLLLGLCVSAHTHAEAYLGYVSQPGDWVGAGQTLYFTDADSTFSTTVRNNGNTINIWMVQGQYDHWYGLDFRAPFGVPLTAGVYNGATRYPFQLNENPGLNFSGDGRGCNTLTGSFEIFAVSFTASGTLEHLDASFAQNCEGWMPTLLGEVLIDNRPPQPPLEITVSVDADATALRNGPLLLTGSLSCNVDAEVTLEGVITQQQSRWRVATAEFNHSTACGPEPTTWSAVAHNVEGKIAKGSATIALLASAQDPNHPNVVVAEHQAPLWVRIAR